MSPFKLLKNHRKLDKLINNKYLISQTLLHVIQLSFKLKTVLNFDNISLSCFNTINNCGTITVKF